MTHFEQFVMSEGEWANCFQYLSSSPHPSLTWHRHRSTTPGISPHPTFTDLPHLDRDLGFPILQENLQNSQCLIFLQLLAVLHSLEIFLSLLLLK